MDAMIRSAVMSSAAYSPPFISHHLRFFLSLILYFCVSDELMELESESMKS